MAEIRPFQCLRPAADKVSRVAALPYDVYNRTEAKAEVEREPMSFLKIDRAETTFPDAVDIYAPEVYDRARELLREDTEKGIYQIDGTCGYYIYRLTMDGRAQSGIVATASVDDYLNNVIKKHENTREEKERDRFNHVDALSAQTGPIFLAYRSNAVINGIVDTVSDEQPLYDFTSPDGVQHTVWKIDRPDMVDSIRTAFAGISDIYIADGHHRAASAVKVSLKRREEHPGYTGNEEFNYFLSVLFPDDQLMIMDYNRCVRDLNGYTKEVFLEKAGEHFSVHCEGNQMIAPEKKGEMTMYLEGQWYRLQADQELLGISDPVKSLDVSLLQEYLLSPVLGIKDPRTDERIDFVGGIRGLSELKKRADSDMKVSFAMYPTSISELFSVADAGLLMPPKSTWFEPKLRSGIFIHKIEK